MVGIFRMLNIIFFLNCGVYLIRVGTIKYDYDITEPTYGNFQNGGRGIERRHGLRKPCRLLLYYKLHVTILQHTSKSTVSGCTHVTRKKKY